MSETGFFQVSAEGIAKRLDQYLDECLPHVSRAQIKRLIDTGAVTVDSQTSKPGYRLRGGEAVRVNLPEPVAPEVTAEEIPLEVLYEDAALIVINKPAHLVVHPAPGHPQGTLVNALLHHCRDLSGVGGELRPGIVHRLDKATSGVMVATKNDQTHQCLARQFKDHHVKRCYRALVHGLVHNDKGVIDLPIGRHPQHRKKMSTRSRKGRQAVTHWQVLQHYEQDQMSLLDLTLETGRTHQIRVHLATAHHPVVGDPLYAGSGRTSRITDTRLRNMVQHLDRQFLHAWRLGFEHPDGRHMMFQAALPQELQAVLDYLNAKHNVFQPEDDIVPYAGMMEEDSDENR